MIYLKMNENEKVTLKAKLKNHIENKNKYKNINFFKKIIYSIARINKYDEMSKEGLKSAIKYFLCLITLMSTILSVLSTYVQLQTSNNAPFMYYFALYFVIYFATIGIFFIVDIAVIGIVATLLSKAKNNKLDKSSVKRLYTISIYSSTLSIILYIAYMIFSYFTKIAIPLFDIFDLIIAYIYLIIVLKKDAIKSN